MTIRVEISVGEFLDKLSILEIKAERIDDPAKLGHVRRELETMRAAWAASPFASADPGEDYAQLAALNRSLWDIEDEIRGHEARGDFGAEFIQLARSVYTTNDRRSQLKQRLNLRLGSDLVEVKSYRGGDAE